MKGEECDFIALVVVGPVLAAIVILESIEAAFYSGRSKKDMHGV